MSSTYKGNLAVGGATFDKNKVQLRRPTPDSDVLASSDDDRDHVPSARPMPTNVYPGARRPSSGWLQDIQPNRKFSLPSVSFAGSQPTTPALELPQQSRPSTSAFPWNTNSFTAVQGGSGTRLKEIVPSPTTALPPGERALPSPTAFETEDGIGFLLNQQNPIRKSVRSQSYSVGQGDVDNSPIGQFNRMRSLRNRPSKPSLLGESPAALSQLREDDTDDMNSSNGSQQGVALPVNYWDNNQSAQLKQVAMENARVRNRATSTGSPLSQQPQRRKTTQALRNMGHGDYAIDEGEDTDRYDNPHLSLTRRFSEHVSAFAHEPEVDFAESSKKPQWSSNVQPIGLDNLGRRHSFAHYGSHTSNFQLSSLGNTQEEDEDVTSPLQASQSPALLENFDASAYFAGHGPASRAINASAISAAHPDPIVPQAPVTTANPYAVPTTLGRPGRRLFVVAFKCSRADIYYLYDNTGLEIRRGDLVITEGDRGCDLGQVTHADVTLEDAKKFKKEANEEHFRWLVMFSQYSLAGTSNDSGMLGALARANGFPNSMNRAQLTGMGAQQDQDAKPRMIKRLAQQHEILGLRDKEGQEAKAKRVGAQKAAEHKFPMEILDAEFQADFHKLTFFYYADAYINFNHLVVDLFKHFKIRIWMSAVNPASVVNPAGLMQVQPPSAIGPGAVIHPNTANNSLPVGPGFGNNSFRAGGEQYGRNRNNNAQAGYDETFFPFSHQVPNFAPQAAYQMPQWNHQQFAPDMYGRYGAFQVPGSNYPRATASASPMNYGAYYPPTTYSASPAFNHASSGSSFRGGYPATSGAASTNTTGYSGVSAAGPSQSQYATSGAGHGNSTTPSYNSGSGHGSRQTTTAMARSTGAGYNNSYTTSMPPSSTAYDPALMAAMQSMAFGN